MKKGILLLCIGIAAVISLAGCASGQKKNESLNESSLSQESAGETAYHKITAEEAKKMMDEGDVIVVDVRRADEYSAKHIPGAILVPMNP